MSSNCPSASLNYTADAFHNVTQLLIERYKDSPKDDWDRLFKCWGYLDCGDCHRSDGFCGWCPISHTCLPLPTYRLSRAFPLLSPMRYKYICAERSERFELRTGGLGCQVSTITFLTSIVTILCTLFSVLVLYLSFKCAKWIGLGMRARKGGYRVYPNEEHWRSDVWVRGSESWSSWWRRLRGEQKEFEVREVDEGSTRQTGRNWWSIGRNRKIDFQGAERRPLLDGDHDVNVRRP